MLVILATCSDSTGFCLHFHAEFSPARLGERKEAKETKTSGQAHLEGFPESLLCSLSYTITREALKLKLAVLR